MATDGAEEGALGIKQGSWPPRHSYDDDTKASKIPRPQT